LLVLVTFVSLTVLQNIDNFVLAASLNCWPSNSRQHHSIEKNNGPVTIMMEALPIHIHRIRDAALQSVFLKSCATD
jgi:hypothetical protein